MAKQLNRVIFTCGGTAGHINPAIALAQRIAADHPDTSARSGDWKRIWCPRPAMHPYCPHLQLPPFSETAGAQA